MWCSLNVTAVSPAQTRKIHKHQISQTISASEKTGGSNGQMAPELVVAALTASETPETRGSLIILTLHLTDSSSCRLQLLPIIVPSPSRAVLDHKLHLLTFAYPLQRRRVDTVAAVSSGEGPPSSWADGRDGESRGTCCSSSLLMFSRFYHSFIIFWAFIHSIIALWNAISHVNQLFLRTAAPDVPFPVWNTKEVTAAQSSAQHMNVIPSSDPSINIKAPAKRHQRWRNQT